MAEYYRVVRTFLGPESRRLMPGEVVEASGWRNAVKLMNQGRMVPTPAPQTPSLAPEGATRKEAAHGQPRH